MGIFGEKRRTNYGHEFIERRTPTATGRARRKATKSSESNTRGNAHWRGPRGSRRPANNRTSLISRSVERGRCERHSVKLVGRFVECEQSIRYCDERLDFFDSNQNRIAGRQQRLGLERLNRFFDG